MIPNIRSNNERQRTIKTKLKVSFPSYLIAYSSRKKTGTRTAASRKNSPNISMTSFVFFAGTVPEPVQRYVTVTGVVLPKAMLCKAPSQLGFRLFDVSITQKLQFTLKGNSTCGQALISKLEIGCYAVTKSN